MNNFMSIDWDEIGTLHHLPSGRDIRTDPLWILLTTALQGHEGWVEDMTIIMKSGHRYAPEDICNLATRPDRKRGQEYQ